MSMIRWGGTVAAAVAMMGMAATPAEAQRYGRGRHHHGDRVDGGDVLLGAILAGGLIALVSAASKSSRDRADAPPPADYDRDAPPPADDGADAPPPPGDDGAAPPPGGDYSGGGAGAGGGEDAAVDACAAAAEDEGRNHAPIARVTKIGQVDPARGGGYYVNGTIELAQGYRDASPVSHGFRCSALGTGAPRVVIDGIS